MKRSILIASLLVTVTATVAAIALRVSGSGYEYGSGPDAVSVLQELEVATVETAQVPVKIHFNGRIQAKNRIELFSEIPGSFLRPAHPFKEGTYFRQGELLVNIDDSEPKLQLQASRSSFRSLVSSLMPDIRLDYSAYGGIFEEYLRATDPGRTLPVLPRIEDEQLRFFLSSRGLYDRYYQVRSAEARLQKFKTEAPFNGTLVTARVEEGSRVSPQTHLGTFISDDKFELVATLNHREASAISVGDEVTLVDRFRSGVWKGVVERKNASIDRRTQGIRIYIGLTGAGLRDGLYLEGYAEKEGLDNSTLIPRSALLRTGHVYVIRNGIIVMQPVEVTGLEGGNARVTGLQNGERIITNPARPLAGTRVSN